MASSAPPAAALPLDPGTFPLLKLPNVACLHVLKLWDPFEVLNFSRISKNSKRRAKSINLKANHISLSNAGLPSPLPIVMIRFPNDIPNGQWLIRTFEEQLPPQYLFDGRIRSFDYFATNANSEALKIMEQAMEVFGISEMRIDLDTRFSSRDEMKEWLDWSMQSSSTVGSLKFQFMTTEDILFLSESYRKETERLFLRSHEIPFQEQVFLPPTEDFEIRFAKTVMILPLPPTLAFLIGKCNSAELNVAMCQASVTDMNAFFKNWISGSTNSELKRGSFMLMENMDLGAILNGIEMIPQDPRVVKRNVTFDADQQSLWIYGGIDIKTTSGKTGTLQWKNYCKDVEEAEVPIEWVEEYERLLQDENEDVAQEDDEDIDEDEEEGEDIDEQEEDEEEQEEVDENVDEEDVEVEEDQGNNGFIPPEELLFVVWD